MSAPEVHVQITEYDVSVLPQDCLDRHAWGLKVVYRGKDRWAVVQLGYCLGTDGVWDYESIPSERRDEWLATHRFDHDTARPPARAESVLTRIDPLPANVDTDTGEIVDGEVVDDAKPELPDPSDGDDPWTGGAK